MTSADGVETCRTCDRLVPQEWVPAVLCAGRPLPGTGVWRRDSTDGLCASCFTSGIFAREQKRSSDGLERALVKLMGGPKPYREFTFERYEVTNSNERAYSRARDFSPKTSNLYFWGACGVGKTHLAYAIARAAMERGDSVSIWKPPQLLRAVRMKEDEQALIDRIVRMRVLVLDDLGIGQETPYARQVLQEILDGRDFQDRGGLVVTSKYSLGNLAEKLNDDTIPSRLAGLCEVIEIGGDDRRLVRRLAASSVRHNTVDTPRGYNGIPPRYS